MLLVYMFDYLAYVFDGRVYFKCGCLYFVVVVYIVAVFWFIRSLVLAHMLAVLGLCVADLV